jgi:hypothetical protein
MAGMNPRVAQMFMRIARHPVISNANSYSHLPPALHSLYELSRLEQDRLEVALESGTVGQTTPLGEVRTIVRREKTGSPIIPRPCDPDPAFTPQEAAECIEMASYSSDAFEQAITEGREQGDLSRQNVISILYTGPPVLMPKPNSMCPRRHSPVVGDDLIRRAVTTTVDHMDALDAVSWETKDEDLCSWGMTELKKARTQLAGAIISLRRNGVA